MDFGYILYCVAELWRLETTIIIIMMIYYRYLPTYILGYYARGVTVHDVCRAIHFAFKYFINETLLNNRYRFELRIIQSDIIILSCGYYFDKYFVFV